MLVNFFTKKRLRCVFFPLIAEITMERTRGQWESFKENRNKSQLKYLELTMRKECLGNLTHIGYTEEKKSLGVDRRTYLICLCK